MLGCSSLCPGGYCHVRVCLLVSASRSSTFVLGCLCRLHALISDCESGIESHLPLRNVSPDTTTVAINGTFAPPLLSSMDSWVCLVGSLPWLLLFTTLTNTRYRTPRIRGKRRRSLLWSLPRHHCRQRQRSLRSHLAGEQHSRAVEACSLLCHACRVRWRRRYHRRHSVPFKRQAGVSSRYLDVYDLVCADCVDYDGDGLEVQQGKQQSACWREAD